MLSPSNTRSQAPPRGASPCVGCQVLPETAAGFGRGCYRSGSGYPVGP
jgi:hypothetical protein